MAHITATGTERAGEHREMDARTISIIALGQARCTTGVYARILHPQYVGVVLVMFGFLLQWPTLLTLAMFPVLVFMYVCLARSEEREAMQEFGHRYRAYMTQVPGVIPRLRPPGGKARA